MSTTQRQSVIRSMKSVRVKWIRIDVPGNFPFDALVQDAIAAGMRVDALIVSSNGEATESAVGTLAARVVRHLKPMGVETYEVLNEVNGRIPALAYVSMLQAAYRAIKSVDPGATVLSSGLKPNTGANAPAAYLESMYAAGAKGFMDAVAIHPYSFPDMPMQPDGWNTFYNLPKVREVMVRHGDSAKKIWLTEFGCPTGTDGGYPAACTDDTLAQQIVQAYGQASRWAWIGHVFIYSWQDDVLGRDGDFGLYYADGSPKTASVAAYERAVRSLGMASTAP